VTKYRVSGNREAESGPSAANCARTTINSFYGEEALKDA
jgi:hypothetical protein